MIDGGPVFILGAERSGSTWLANIFDSHPGVAMMMEPFTPYAQLFPGLPDRNTYLSEGGPAVTELIRDGYAQMLGAKTLWFFRPGRLSVLRWLDEMITSASYAVSSTSPFPVPLRVLRYRLLNLNSAGRAWRQFTRKDAAPQRVVIKELRVNFKVPALHEAFPDARYLVALRDPRPQLASIRRLFAGGSLPELRRSLATFPQVVRDSQSLTRYGALLDGAHLNGDLNGLLARWWVISYDTLLRDLEQAGAPAHIVYHEDMSLDPLGHAGRALEFADLGLTAEVESFVAASSSTGGRGGNLDTNRRSAEHVDRARAAVDPGLSRAVDEVMNSVELTEALLPYVAA